MDKIIHLSRKLECPTEEAFKAFIENKKLQKWLVPLANVEAKLGGLYELFWEPDNKENNSTIGCRITALVDNQLLAFEWRSPEQFKHFANNADPLTHVMVVFIPEGKKTVVHMVHSGWRSSDEWEAARIWQERAWNIALDVLEKEYKSGKTV